MSEPEDLFARAREAPPHDPGVVDRVGARLATRAAPRTHVRALPLALASAAVLLALVIVRGPMEPSPSAPPAREASIGTDRVQSSGTEPDEAAAPRPAPDRVQSSGTEPGTELAAPRPAPMAKRSAAPVVKAVAPVAAEATRAKPAPVVAARPSAIAAPEPDPHPPLPPQRMAYRPRAIHEFVELDWHRLEHEQLSEAVRRIVARRDPNALLAALDRMPLADADLLSVRGQLRAAAARCPEALADVDRALDQDPALNATGSVRATRAACAPPP